MPLKAKAGLFKGKILSLKKIYAYAGLACLIVLIALAIIFLFPKRGQAYDSIAVLPLQNLSRDPEQEFFSDGMHEALITELSRIKAIKVISRTSVMGYKATKKKIPEIARELGVAAIVEGTTVRSGNIVRINVQLIDGRSDKHIWADSFDREYRDILTLQSEAALAIAQKIQASLTPEEAKILARTRPVNPEPYEAYLKGMFKIGSSDRIAEAMRADLEKSIQYFEQALKIGPKFAPAHAGIAVAYDLSSFAIPPKEVFPKAKDAALKALTLDDSLADAHNILADIKASFEWDWDGAEREWKRALELNPNHSMGLIGYAIFLNGQGRKEEAVSHADRALEVDPFTLFTLAHLVQIYAKARHYDRAIALGKESLILFPNSLRLHTQLVRPYLLKGSFKEAFAEIQKMIELKTSPQQKFHFLACALSGEKSKAKDALSELLKIAKETYVNPYTIACTYAALGEKDKALEWLGKCYEERGALLYTIKSDRYFDSLHGDPRFTALLKKMGLEK